MSIEELAYPAEYLVEESKNAHTAPQSNLMIYLREVLKWYYRQENWFIAVNLDFYHPAIPNYENLITMDIAVLKDVYIPSEVQAQMSSYFIEEPERPAPKVTFEISSRSTWPNDVKLEFHQKPALYGRIGVREYFAYDPNQPQVWTKAKGIRLRGWNYDKGRPVEMERDERGWLWSEELNSWLGPDGYHLRLYDTDGRQRLNRGEEAEQRLREAEGRIAELQRLLDQLQRNPQE
jgi:hypothetical protein